MVAILKVYRIIITVNKTYWCETVIWKTLKIEKESFTFASNPYAVDSGLLWVKERELFHLAW